MREIYSTSGDSEYENNGNRANETCQLFEKDGGWAKREKAVSSRKTIVVMAGTHDRRRLMEEKEREKRPKREVGGGDGDEKGLVTVVANAVKNRIEFNRCRGSYTILLPNLVVARGKTLDITAHGGRRSNSY